MFNSPFSFCSYCRFEGTGGSSISVGPGIEDSTDDEEDKNDSMFEAARNELGLPKKKSGRNAKWSESLLNDAVDIIVNENFFRRKLIFENTKNCRNAEIYMKVLEELRRRAQERDESLPFNEIQLRTRFKKAVADCKKAALTIRSASGIKRFQSDRGFGPWFNTHFELVKTRDSCQPEQAIEPSAHSEGSSPHSDSDRKEEKVQKLYVPLRKKTRKDDMKTSMDNVMGMMKIMIEENPVKDFIAFAREEAEKSRKQEMCLMQMLVSQGCHTSNCVQAQVNARFPGNFPTGTFPTGTSDGGDNSYHHCYEDNGHSYYNL